MVKTLLMTLTGEIFQPIRVYYDLFDKTKAVKALSKLRCIKFDSTKGRWVWLYADEAKRIKLKKSYSDVPKKLRPIVLGSFFFKKEGEMYLELRSFERATEAIVFFDRYIDRSIAKVIDVITVNRLFSSEEYKINLDVLFADKKVVNNNPEDLLKQMEPLKEEKSIKKRLKTAFSFIMKEVKKQLPEVERFPIHFCEDGITPLKTSLIMRQNIALEYYKGNKNYNFMDILKKVPS